MSIIKVDYGNIGGGIPSENVEIQTNSWGGVSASRSFTFTKQIKLLFACRSGNDIQALYKIQEDGTPVLLKSGTYSSLPIAFSSDLKTCTITSSWSASALYFVVAITTDDLGEVDYTNIQ